MKAVVQTAVGQPVDVLELVEVDVPQPGPGEILMDVRLASVHHGDILQIRGLPSVPEAAGFVRRGSEAVGAIRSLGAGVDVQRRLAVGDRVVGFPTAGAWAQSVVIPASAAIPVPAEVGDEAAAQLFVNYTTARMVIRGLRASTTDEALRTGAVLVTGAGTVVGRLLLHFLKEDGIKAIGLTRSAVAAHRVAAELAGVEVAATEDPQWRSQLVGYANGKKIVGVLDCVAGSLIRDLLPLVADEAAFITYGALGGMELTFGPVELVSRQLVARGVVFGKWFRELSQEERETDIRAAFKLATDLPALFKVSSIHDLAEIKDAVRAVEAPGRNGFVFVKP